jgi:cysteine desulfurase
MNKEHYFDWAATAPVDEEIIREALETSFKCWANPSSIHQGGKEAKDILEKARTSVATSLGVKSENIFFTSGGTESDHIPLLATLNKPEKGSVLISSIEHPALREQAMVLKKCGFKVNTIPVNKDGIITPEEVVKCLTDDTLFVTVMAVNNETGAIQPIYKIADAITEFYKGKRRPKFHVDCVQALGKIPIDISYKGIDSAAFSAHKICGPRGIGVLYLATKAQMFEGFLRGGGQESNVRSGTENLFGITAISKCIEKYRISPNNGMNERQALQEEWALEFIKKLSTIKCCTILPHIRLDQISNTELSSDDKIPFSPWIVQASFKNIPGQVMVRALDAKGFCISTGSACSAKKQSRPILEAMHVSQGEMESAVRFSFGSSTSKNAMDELFEAISEVCKTFER